MPGLTIRSVAFPYIRSRVRPPSPRIALHAVARGVNHPPGPGPGHGRGAFPVRALKRSPWNIIPVRKTGSAFRALSTLGSFYVGSPAGRAVIQYQTHRKTKKKNCNGDYKTAGFLSAIKITKPNAVKYGEKAVFF